MENDRSKPEVSDTVDSVSESHLFDAGTISELATWVAQAAASGAIGTATVASLVAIKRRLGSRKAATLRDAVYAELKKVRGKGHVSNRDLRLRVDRLFDDAGI